jgi:trigger factor
MEKQAKDQLKSKYASKLIAEKEKLELSDKAYKEKYDEYAQSYGYENGDAFIEANGEDGEEKLKESILLDTAMTWVADHAKFVEAETEK